MRKQQWLKASAIVKGANKSILTGQVSAETIEDFLPPKENIQKALKRLKRLGFEVEPNEYSISITGTFYRFEKVFQLQPEHQTTVIPQNLTDLIEAVVFPQPTRPNKPIDVTYGTGCLGC